jgi:hypothetical protein
MLRHTLRGINNIRRRILWKVLFLPVNVSIPPALREYTRSQSEVIVDASTVGELLGGNFDGHFPGLGSFLVNDQSEL